jgi:large subunit ribosomal protein L17
MPKLFGELRERYMAREGGYTRVLRTESKNIYDQGESAILELVDGPKDSRFMMTAKAVARDRVLGKSRTPITQKSVEKLTKFRGEAPFEEMVQKFVRLETGGREIHEQKTDAETEAAGMADREREVAKELLRNASTLPTTKKQRHRDRAPQS